MLRRPATAMTTTALCALLALPVQADRALLAGVPDPASTFWFSPPTGAADTLAAGGYEVLRVSGDVAQLRDALVRMLSGIAQEDRLVIHLDGYFARSNGMTWYLGTTPAPSDLPHAGAAGVALDVVLEIAAQVPGGAFVLLGARSGGPEHGPGLRAGIGPLDIPQGVTVISGGSDDITRMAQRALYRPGVDLRAEVENADDLSVQGFAPRGLSIVRVGAPPAPPAVVPAPVPVTPAPAQNITQERAFWDSVRLEDTESAYRDYLQRYPRGQFRAQAQQALDVILNDPMRVAQDAEAALALTRAQRRTIQADLTALGFSTRGVDGIFGAGTRAAIRGWQGSTGGRGFAETGFLDGIQIARLSRQAEDLRAEQAALEAQDDALWDRFGGVNADENDLRAYLDRYPQGRHADEARQIIGFVDEVRRTPAQRRDQNAWIDARRIDSPDSYRAYLETWPDGFFAQEARTRLGDAVGNDPATLTAARAEEERLNLNPVTRLLIERRLSQIGLNTGNVDGFFTAETREALGAYQRDRGIPATGFVTELTATRMLAELGLTFSRN